MTGGKPDSNPASSPALHAFESVDYEDIEFVPPSAEEIDVEFEEERNSVDHLLAMTGEHLSIEDQRESLKEAGRTAPEARKITDSRASTSIPTPYELGAVSAPASFRPLPPPLPGTAPSANVTPPPRRSDSDPPAPPPLPPGARVPPTRGPLPDSKASVSSRPPSQPARKPPPLPLAEERTPSPASATPKSTAFSDDGARLIELLDARIERLKGTSDTVGLARAYIELSLVDETLGNDNRTTEAAEAALRIVPDLAAAHAILRRRLHSRERIPQMLRHLEGELEVASAESTTTELIVEKARLLEASDRPAEAREAWELALGRSPRHPAALKGLEANLARVAYGSNADAQSWDDLAKHLGRMSDAFAAQPALAAWLHVERAQIFEFRLGRIDAARSAYERALQLDSSIGPVRDACIMHITSHHDAPRLAALFAEEARIETTPNRSARLEYEAAALSRTALGDDARAIELLEHAASKVPANSALERRILDELVHLYEISAQYPELARARRARLPFFTDPTAIVYELRRISSIEERLGNIDEAISAIRRALSVKDDPLVVEELDRLLQVAGKSEERIALWHDVAQRAKSAVSRARALDRAAQLAERIGDYEGARHHLRAAWVAAPGDPAILDALSRLTSPTPSESFDHEVRALIELYAQAAQSAASEGRRIAYLEKVATLWEELVGDPTRAARTYEEILDCEPSRRSAILGLQRTAGRTFDDLALSKALALEASLSEGPERLDLLVRSADVLARVDPSRASAVVTSVLAQDPSHPRGRELETRLHEEGGRWEQAANSLRARIQTAETGTDAATLWLSLAHIQDTRLRSPKDAAKSLAQARKADPTNPAAPEEITRVLEAADDARALSAAMESLAEDATTSEERARHLARAAEINELRLDDDVGAASLYSQALEESPQDEWVAERLLRVLARRVFGTPAALGPAVASDSWNALIDLLVRRSETETIHTRRHAVLLHRASLLIAANTDLAAAAHILDAILETDPANVAGLRLREAIARRERNYDQLAQVLKLEGTELDDVSARMAALWELASIERFHLNSGESVATYTSILELDPTDPSALEAAVRHALAAARKGDGSARRAAIAALRSVNAVAQDDTIRLANELRLALLLDAQAGEGTDSDASEASAREALTRLRDANALDPLSVTAATSLARLTNRVLDLGGAVAASVSLAELSVQPEVRARYLVHASELLLSDADEAELGPMPDRIERAARHLEKALDADPESISAATRLAELRTSQGLGERLLDIFRPALRSAKAREAIILLGSSIAQVARDDIGDIGIAIEAMRRVREAAPDHVPSLLTLAELFIAQQAWPEAVEILEDVAARPGENGPRITALFALASVYERLLSRPNDAEDSLRRALAIEGDNPRAIRALIHRLAAKHGETDETGTPHDKTTALTEIATLLERLALVEGDAHAKCDVLLELADIRLALKDPSQASKALVEAVATAPGHPRALSRLARLFRAPETASDRSASAYAQALASVIERGRELGTEDPRWFATLGTLEVNELNRLRDGVEHLSRAIELDPSRHESRFELASAHSRLGAHEDAARVLMSMLMPTSRPLLSIADPARALVLLEEALMAERRKDEATVVTELRAIAGDLDDTRQAWLRARRLPMFEAHHVALDRTTLVSHVVPTEGRHIFLELAAAIAGVETKLLRADLKDVGITSRERVSKRSGHPSRNLLERLAKAIGVNDFELVISANVSRTRVIAQDTLWVVVPKTLSESPESAQLASFGRALARIALGVPWLEELPLPHIQALLYATARMASSSFGKEDLDATTVKLTHQYEQGLARELSRKQRQNLEKIGASMTGARAQPLGIDVLIRALAQAELRTSYLLTGDILATLDELRGLDAKLFAATETAGHDSVGAVLDHPFAGDVVSFALTPEATALRRRVGSSWMT